MRHDNDMQTCHLVVCFRPIAQLKWGADRTCMRRGILHGSFLAVPGLPHAFVFCIAIAAAVTVLSTFFRAFCFDCLA